MDGVRGLGELVRWHRRRGGWSQEELGERADVSVRTLRGIERGHVRDPHPVTLRLLADALGLDQPGRDLLLAARDENGAGAIAELPPAVPDFTGRPELVSRLEHLLREAALDGLGAPVIVIGGPAGVGKTALALHVAHRVRSAFPDGQLYAELRGAQPSPATPEDVLEAFLRSLGLPGEKLRNDLAGRAALLRSRLDGRRMLLLLDDARDASQVRPLLPAASTCAVLVTTRGRLGDLAGASVVDLGVLADGEATALLARVAGREAVGADTDAARRVVVACGGLPLAVRIAGARAAAWPPWGLRRLADLLADERRRLDQLAVGDLEVRSGIGATCAGLTAEEQRAFRLLGFLAVPALPEWMAPALLDRPAAQAERLLERLLDARLVDAAPADGVLRYRLHDLVGLYARERAEVEDTDDELRAAVARAGGAWLALADQPLLHLSGGFVRTATGPTARWPVPSAWADGLLEQPGRWFATERATAVALVRQAVAMKLDELAWDLVGAAVPFLALGGHFDDIARIVEQGLVAARRLGDPRAEGFLLRVRGDLLAELDRYHEAGASLREARVRARAAGDECNEAWTLRGLGCVARAQGRGQEAGRLLQAALDLFARLGDWGGTTECHLAAGAAARDRGEPETATHHYREALHGFRRLGNRLGESLTLLSWGRLHQTHGRREDSLRCYQAAAELSRTIDHPAGLAWALTLLGDLHVDDERHDEAEPILREALDVSRRMGDRNCEAVALHALGRARLATGDPVSGEELLRQGIAINEDLDLPRQRGQGLLALGDALLLRGARDEAAQSWRQASRLLVAAEAPEAGDAAERLLGVG